MVSLYARPKNKLLSALEPSAYERLVPRLKPLELRAKQVLYKPDQPIREVYFPDDAVISLMAVMNNGDTLETSTVGLEGASWISADVGASSFPCETIVAIGGTAHRLSIEELDREMRQDHHFRDVVTAYSHALLIHSLRMTGCTGLHSLEQRCARWILLTSDRVPAGRFSITHEFLAMLLGVSRPALSAVIADFQRRGLLLFEHGRLSIRDRRGLCDAACECYEAIKRFYEDASTRRS
jgi:Crp-like helix-turn-helix protein